MAASVLWCADDEPAASRVDAWQSAICDSLVPFDLRIDGGPDLGGRILSGDFGAVRVGFMSAPPLEGARTAKLIRRSDPELFKLEVQVQGQLVLEQGGREALLRPGDLALVDFSRPCHVGHARCGVAVVMFPRSLLPIPVDEVARLTAVRIPGENGIGGLVASLVVQMARHLDDLPAADGLRLSTVTLDLLGTMLAERAGRPFAVQSDSYRRALTYRLHAFVEANLGDPTLTPAMVAAANHISLRYLYKLFEAEGTPVAAWIRTRRLERCRQDLLDPRLPTRPVSAIAARWGFVDAAHFSRLFRATYGIPPGEYRQVHL